MHVVLHKTLTTKTWAQQIGYEAILNAGHMSGALTQGRQEGTTNGGRLPYFSGPFITFKNDTQYSIAFWTIIGW